MTIGEAEPVAIYDPDKDRSPRPWYSLIFSSQIGRRVIGTGLVIAAAAAGHEAAVYIDKNAGPKYGITAVNIKGCGAADTLGPQNIKNMKFTAAQVESLGVVTVTLVTKEMREGELRPSGMFEDPTVTVNMLDIECGEALPPAQEQMLINMVSD